MCIPSIILFDSFPTCQVRVVRFYVSCLLLSSSPLLLPLPNRDLRHTVFSVGPQPRPSTPSVPCRTSTTTIPAQCSLPDLNHDHPRPVFPAGPQPRPSTPSVPCRTSTASIQTKASDKSGVNKLFWNVMVGITRSKVIEIQPYPIHKSERGSNNITEIQINMLNKASKRCNWT